MHRNEMERRFNARWGDLAEYNAEVSRGYVHTPEHAAAMRKKQQQYDFMRERGLDVWFDPIPEPPFRSTVTIDVHTDDVAMPIRSAYARSTGDMLHKVMAIQLPADEIQLSIVGTYEDLRKLVTQMAKAVDLEVMT